MPGKALEIQLIGALAVLRNGEPVVLPQSKKTRALLAYLILNDGPQRREKLCELLWQVPDDPRGSLRWSLSKLRGVVDAEGVTRIKADREQVSFIEDDVDVDFISIQGVIAQGMGQLSCEDLAALANRFSGDLLEGLELSGQPEFETWRLAQQETARKARCAVLRALVDLLADNPAEQANRLYELVQIEPYDIDLHCRLITALAQSGRAKEAERQKTLSFETLKDIDGADLGRLDKALKTKPHAAQTVEDKPAAMPLHQEIRFCKAADGVQIAYGCVGDGPPLVKAANWLNHLEFDWESPVWRHMFRAFSSGRCFIRYDARGNGLSDWNTRDFSFDAMVADLEAVIDALGLEQFPLLGISQGCAICIEYAVRYPKKVSKLILYGGYARGWRLSGIRNFIEQTEAMITLTEIGWGQDNPAFRQMFTSQFMPDAPIENQQWFNELQRMTTSPKNAARLLRALGDVDVRDRLGEVKAPTLVMHASHDMRVPFDAGRELAGGISGARFAALDTKNHLIPESDPAWPQMLSVMEKFLAE